MKESDYMQGLAKYMVKRDKHLALNLVQAKQLVKYIRQYEDMVGMLPPFQWDGEGNFKSACNLPILKWEDEDEKK